MTQMERIQVPTQPQYRDGFKIGQAAVARNSRAVAMAQAAEYAPALLTTAYVDALTVELHKRVVERCRDEIEQADAVLREVM